MARLDNNWQVVLPKELLVTGTDAKKERELELLRRIDLRKIFKDVACVDSKSKCKFNA